MSGRSMSFASEQRGVQLEVGQVGRPDQRRQVARQAEVDRRALRSLDDRRRLHPVGPVRRAAASRRRTCSSTPFGIALQRERPVAQVREQHRRDARVVVDHLALGEPGLGVEHLVEVGELEPLPVDLDTSTAVLTPLCRLARYATVLRGLVRARRAGPGFLAWLAARRRWRSRLRARGCRRWPSRGGRGSARARPSGRPPCRRLLLGPATTISSPAALRSISSSTCSR